MHVDKRDRIDLMGTCTRTYHPDVSARLHWHRLTQIVFFMKVILHLAADGLDCATGQEGDSYPV